MATKIQQKTAQQIVDTVKDVCGHNINFINGEGKIFASTDKARIGDFHEIGQQVIRTGQPIEVEQDDVFFGTQKGVNLPFQYNGEIIAAIGISGVPGEVRKYAYLAQKITSLILREHELDTQNHNKKAQMNYIIHSLISNQTVNHDYLADFIKNHGGNMTDAYRTVLVQLDSRYNPSNLSMIEQQIYENFKITGSRLYTFNYPNEYVLLLEDSEAQNYSRLFTLLAGRYGDVLKVGIGKSAKLTRQHESYESAKIAIQSLGEQREVAVFDELDLEILLGSVPADTRDFFLKRALRTLDEKDKAILKTYFNCDKSLKKTCDILFIHRNTLQYQLEKIRNSSGYDPRTLRGATILYLALELEKYV